MTSTAGGARLTNAQDLLLFLEESFAPGCKAALVETLPGPVREELLHGSKVAYWPMAHDAAYVDALIEFFGEAKARAMWRAYSARLVQSPMLRALFEGSVRLLGLNVGTLARNVPRGWSMTYRNAGICSCAVLDHEVMLDFSELHQEMTKRPLGYYLLLEETFKGLYDVVNDKPKLDYHPNPEHGALHVTFRW